MRTALPGFTQNLFRTKHRSTHPLSEGWYEVRTTEGRYKANWKRRVKLPWRETGPPNHLVDKVDSDQ